MGAVPQQKSIGRSILPAPVPPVVRAATAPRLQLAAAGVKVSKPSDPAEREAESIAKKVMRMAAPEPSIGRSWESPYAARFAHLQIGRSARTVARKDETLPRSSVNFKSELAAAQLAGRPLPDSVKRFMEPRFRADFSKVRIHTGDKAATLNRQVGARAFAYGNQVFFGKDRFKPDTSEGRELIAHELTHTVQQGAAVQRSEDVTVSHSTPEMVQGSWLSEGLDWVAGKANDIPGFRLFTLIVGVNPINMSKVDRTPANVLRGLIELVPGGGLIVRALDNHGIIDKAAAWFMTQIATLANLAGTVRDAIVNFINSIGADDIFLSPFKTWERAKRLFTGPIEQAKNFIASLASGFVELIKAAILRPLGALAQQLPGYDLLKAVLQKDPVTDDPYPRNADTVIGGFMKLAGQSEVWAKMQQAKAVPRAWAWFQTAMEELLGFVKQIPALFIKALKSLELADIILLPMAFVKVGKVFADFVGRFISWAANTAWKLLEIVFDVVSPGAWGYVQRTGAALKSILKNPLPFVGNLVAAAKAGFSGFAGRFLQHLKAGLIEWLTGSLPGIYIPKAFSLEEIVKFVFSVLGLTWANIRQKLVKATSETVVAAMEKGFDIVVTLVTKGPAAAWDKIKEQLANLKDMVVGGITDLVVDAVVKKAIPKLVAMFIPGAGFISAIISIYDTVMTFVQKISKIIQVVNAFITSIVQIAAGNIGAASAKVESILAGLLSLAISFLAGFAGLGNVASKIMGVIAKIRAPIDKALDWLINWIVTMAKKLFAKVFGKDGKPDTRTPAQQQADLAKALKEAEVLQRKPGVKASDITSGLPAIKAKYKMTALDLAVVSKGKGQEKVQVKGKINPEGVSATTDVVEDVMPLVKGDVAGASEQMSAGGITSLFDQVMGARGAQGLKSLEMRVETEYTAAIVGSASPETILGYVIVNNIPLPDYGAVTAVVAIDDVARGDFKNRDGKHAEAGVIGFVQRAIAIHVERAGADPKKVEVLVSQSPCLHKCQPELNLLRRSYPKTAFLLYYKTLHQSTSGSETEDSLKAINKLRRGGWRVFIWNEGKIKSGVAKRK